MSESENQFSLTRIASITGGAAMKQSPIGFARPYGATGCPRPLGGQGLVAAMFILALSQTACDVQEADLRGIKTPIWAREVVEKQKNAALTYATTTYLKPTFYNGAMPLTFTAGKNYKAGEMVNAYFDFADFRNTFVYIDLGMHEIAEGAITTDRSGKLLAEARTVRLLSGESNQLQGIEIEEYHYNPDGRLVFKCKSKVDFPRGVKQAESEAVGRKQRDYYFIWPVRGS